MGGVLLMESYYYRLMRVAAIYDIHGNLPALEAVLGEIRREAIDRLVVGGDVFPGPMAREALECLLRLEMPVYFIHGNGDRLVREQLAGTEAVHLPEQVREVIRWNAHQLDAGHERLLAGWPSTFRLTIDDLGEVLFCHATPRNDTEIFTRLTDEERLRAVFAGVEAPVVVCGHTHMQFDRRIGSLRVVNAGSVGMPFGRPGAYWLLLGPGLDLRRTDYDLGLAAARIRATAYPQAEEFAARHVLQPASEAEILARYSAAELR
jgi:putative phosphoesterase